MRQKRQHAILKRTNKKQKKNLFNLLNDKNQFPAKLILVMNEHVLSNENAWWNEQYKNMLPLQKRRLIVFP